MPEKCIRDYHLFQPDADAEFEVKRIYPNGEFYLFHVCGVCLPDLQAEANKYGVDIKVVPIKSLPK